MKNALSLLLGCVLMAQACCAQTDFSKWVIDTTIGDSKVHILRVPLDKVPDRIQRDVDEVQQWLDENLTKYRNGSYIFRGGASLISKEIKALEPSWPAEYYEEEDKAYIAYTKVQDKRHQDSIYARNIRAEARKQVVKDSLLVVKLTQGWSFISKPYTLVKKGPDDKSITRGKVYLGSFIKIYSETPAGHYILCDLGGVDGWIDMNDKVDNIFQLSASDSLMNILKSGVVYRKFEPSAWQQAETAKEDAEEARAERAIQRRSTAKRVYHVGPRGGCYYYDGNGNKVYVDHSYCY